MKHGSLLQKKPCGVALKRNKYVLPRIRVKRLISVDDQRKKAGSYPASCGSIGLRVHDCSLQAQKKGELLKP